MVRSGPSKGRLVILYHNNDENACYVKSFQDKLTAHLHQYLLVHCKWNPTAIVNLMNSYVMSERYLAVDLIWDKETF